MENEFLDKMADAVQKHVRISYSTEIRDSHIALEQVPLDIFNNGFCTVWREYNGALFECVRLLVRYERSLIAWDEMAGDLDDDIKLTCLADYAHPTFRVACDIPLTFKEQLVKGVVKLEYLAKGDMSLLEGGATSSKDVQRAGYYYKELKRLTDGDPGLEEIQSCLNDELYESGDAKHLQEMHGRSFHDVSTSLMSGRVSVATFGSGAYGTFMEDPIDLKSELEILDRHRARIQRGYELFNARAHELFEGLPR